MRTVKWKKIIFTLMILFSVFFIVTELCIMKYLREYGYGLKELPQTTLVYFRLSDGFTVGKTEKGANIFIGRSEYIYEDVFEKKGYYEADRLGLDGYYNKIGEVKENDHTSDFWICSTRDWCHWFRVYYISENLTIEDF